MGTNVCKMAYRKMIIKPYNDMELAGYHISNGRFVMGKSGGGDVNHPIRQNLVNSDRDALDKCILGRFAHFAAHIRVGYHGNGRNFLHHVHA